jgi:SAM-dependent methyltransferase
MSQETKKTNRLRDESFFLSYLQGSVLDIGAGDNKVTEDAVAFDIDSGDAENILEHMESESFDSVYSSHCLEHMRDAGAAISQWWEIVRPGGYMIIIVPDEDLYEQKCWPSMFNSDHKHTFTIRKSTSWSPVSINLRDLLCELEGAELIRIMVQSDDYDRNLQGVKFSPRMHSLWNYNKSYGIKKHLKRFFYSLAYYPYISCSWLHHGRVIDQTQGKALAQIEAVVRKRARGRKSTTLSTTEPDTFCETTT